MPFAATTGSATLAPMTLPTVRTITAFVSLREVPGASDESAGQLRAAGRLLGLAFRKLKALGFLVQTVRVALNPFEEWASSELVPGVSAAVELADGGFALEAGEDEVPPLLLTVGPATTIAGAALIPEVVKSHPRVTASLLIPAEDESAVLAAEPSWAHCVAAANVIRELALTTEAGNFSFAALAMCQPLIPFFPAAYAPSESTGSLLFALGLEHVDLTVSAVERRREETGGRLSPAAVGDTMRSALVPHVEALEASCRELATECSERLSVPVEYAGVDSSIAPNPHARSIRDLFRAAGVPRVGAAGSVSVATALTAACKSLPVTLTGYCGLMLPPLEDVGLAEDATRGMSVGDLLTLSTVCGIGLDTVPLGRETLEEGSDAIERVVCDVASLAFRLKKPLSVRLFPIKDVGEGDATAFDHPHLCNSIAMKLE
jgi:uncharacterized protein